MKNIIKILTIVLCVFLIFLVFQSLTNNNEEDKTTLISEIMIPVIDNNAFANYSLEELNNVQGRDDYIGCGGKLVYIKKEIDPTERPLEAIYLELFKGDEILFGTNYDNPLSYHIEERSLNNVDVSPLKFEKVYIENNVARVYLIGDYVTIGTCEPPLTEAVLRFAALQYPWIDDVEIYLNNKRMVFVHGGKGEELNTKYIHIHEWPSATKIEKKNFICEETAITSSLSETTTQKLINNRMYCVNVINEGAAGSVYSSYTYTTFEDGNLFKINFILRYSSCGNYSEKENQDCINEREIFNVDLIVDDLFHREFPNL